MVNLHASITCNVCKKFFIGKTVHQSVNQSLNGVAKPPPDKHNPSIRQLRYLFAVEICPLKLVCYPILLVLEPIMSVEVIRPNHDLISHFFFSAGAVLNVW